jgi:hypothetical protein
MAVKVPNFVSGKTTAHGQWNLKQTKHRQLRKGGSSAISECKGRIPIESMDAWERILTESMDDEKVPFQRKVHFSTEKVPFQSPYFLLGFGLKCLRIAQMAAVGRKDDFSAGKAPF